MNLRSHRTHLPALLVSSLALAVVGLHGRARAQEDGDDDKLPEPVTHHVVRPHDAEAPDDTARKAEPVPREEPAAEPLVAPEAAPLTPHKPAAAEPDFGPAEAEPAPAPPRPVKHHKETKREKKERLRREKLAKRHPKAPPPEAGSDLAEPVRAEPSPAETAPTHEAGEGEARRPTGGDDMDFNLLPQKKAQSTEEAASIESRIKTRRTMLQLHQGFGIATAALMAATVVTGQLSYSDRFGGGGSSGQYEAWHDTFEAATVLSFATAGLLAVLAPTPFDHESRGVDSVTVHKWSMLVATLGMGAEIPLGIWTVTREGYVNQGTLALTHLIVGYVTAAALTVGTTALFF